MSNYNGSHKNPQLWAEFRFSVIGHLFSNPPGKGEIKREIRHLSEKVWKHPITGENITFAFKTIEEWYYRARTSMGPIESLRRKPRVDVGRTRALAEQEKVLIIEQYNKHKSWTMKLHADNYNALVETTVDSGIKRHSYPTILRFMKSVGLFRQRLSRNSHRRGYREAEAIRENREIRSYEVEYVSALWHLDFHHGSKEILLPDGTWCTPILLCILDDRSRLICHIQWYLNEDTEALTHGVIQAFQKRGLPRAIMTDNGPAMISEEFTQGLKRLSIVHETTLEYSPYQNGKQESLWGQVEGRLVAMLENMKELDLKLLNDATQAWSEMEYNRKVHSETKDTPVNRFLSDKNVGRPSSAIEELRKAFTKEEIRIQRKSDGTISLSGKRFEIPSRFRHIEKICIRYSRWNMGEVYLTDLRSQTLVCRIYPVNKALNASGERKSMEPLTLAVEEKVEDGRMPALLEKLMADYSATGLPPAYIPEERPERKEQS